MRFESGYAPLDMARDSNRAMQSSPPFGPLHVLQWVDKVPSKGGSLSQVLGPATQPSTRRHNKLNSLQFASYDLKWQQFDCDSNGKRNSFYSGFGTSILLQKGGGI